MNQKIITCRVSKIHKWVHIGGGKLPKECQVIAKVIEQIVP